MLVLLLVLTLQVPTETIVGVQIHGNTVTSDDDMRRLAGIQDGMPFEADTIAKVTERLRAARRFESVQVLKRFASISDLSQIMLVIIVDEGAVHIQMTGDPAHPTRVVRNKLPRVLVLPVLGAEDGYGPTYGVRLALPDPAGKRSRLAFPLTWGGVKRAAAEFEKSIENEPIDRLRAGASISRITNPLFEKADERERMWVRGEREAFGHALRGGATAGWQHVSFGDLNDRFVQTDLDLVVDTRTDPALPRNAVFGRAAWEHLFFDDGRGINRVDLDGRGYLGLFGQNVLAVRVQRRDADHPLPLYLQPLLGGITNLRGFRAGTAAGDTLVTGSLEVIVPLTPALSFGRLGVSGFTDAGTVYAKGEHFADQHVKQGYGVGVWITAAFFRFTVAAAHGVGSSTRVHVGGDLTF